MYGNRELSIMSALESVRDFKSSKGSAHEKIIDLVVTVQRARTILESLDAAQELTGDRETLASIMLALPSGAQGKWYDRDVPDDETTVQKGNFLLSWLERQRKNAVRLHLDTIATKMRATSPIRHKNTGVGESTDKGLASNSLHVLNSGTDAQTKPKPKVKPPDGPNPPGDSTGTGGGCIEVRSLQDAMAVAERRKASLVAKKMDKCPVCSQVHIYERTWTMTQPPVKPSLVSTHLTTCDKFMALSPDSKLATVMENAGCLVCAAWDHNTHRFPGGKTIKDPPVYHECGRKDLRRTTREVVHEAAGTGGSHSVVASSSSQGPGLYEVYLAPVHPPGSPSAEPGMIMIDPGSDTNFIRHDFAVRLGLKGQKCSFHLKVVDREVRALETSRYKVEIEDKDGQHHLVDVVGLETITVLPPDPDLTPISHLVEQYPEEMLQRPQGEVDMLVGLKNSSLHVCMEAAWGDLRLLRGPLGCGWSLRGCHPDLRHPAPSLTPSLSADAYLMRQAEHGQAAEFSTFHIQTAIDFQERDELGTKPTPVCMKCRGCRDCTFRHRRLTPAEQEVVAKVERGMEVDSVAGIITATYPWKKCAERLLDNRQQAQRIQESMERHMVALGTHAGFVEEMLKSVVDGKVRKLEDDEMMAWHGPVNYITTFAVVKPESISTRTRVM